MLRIHYGVIQIGGEWMVIAEGLRLGPYATEAEAEQTARRMADEAAGLEVQLHIQDDAGELHREQVGGDTGGADPAALEGGESA
jgi:hypothetical protein